MDGTEQEHRSHQATVAPASTDDDISVAVVFLIATLAAAVVAQGAFAGPSRWLVAAGLAAVAMLTVAQRRPVHVSPVMIAACALGAWILWRGVTSDALTSALWQVGLLCAVGITVATARRASDSEREVLLSAIVIIGIGVSISGWLGAAFRIEPWGNPAPSSWRASSTLTYPNAAAAAMTMAVMVVLARGRNRSLRNLDAIAATVLIAGVIATQSRGGALALFAGLAVFALLVGPTVMARLLLAPVAGAVVAAVIALPSLATSAEPNPSRMIAALFVGVLVTAATTVAEQHVPGSRRCGLVLVPFAAALAVTQRDRFTNVVGDRLQLTSADRANTTREALSVLDANLFTGVGPGNLNLIWRFEDRLVTTRFVHNEYVQLAAELGLIGAVLLALSLASGAGLLWSARNRATASPTWVAGVAAFAAFGVHSGFDFLWHIPAIPLIGAAVFGCAVSRTGSTQFSLSTNVDEHSAVDPPKGSNP